jgi:hypothetical protein
MVEHSRDEQGTERHIKEIQSRTQNSKGRTDEGHTKDFERTEERRRKTQKDEPV